MKKLLTLMIISMMVSCGESKEAPILNATFESFKVIHTEYIRAYDLKDGKFVLRHVPKTWQVLVYNAGKTYKLNFTTNPRFKEDSIYSAIIVN